MNKKLEKFLKNTVTLEEFTKDFTPEEWRIVDYEIQYYHIVVGLRKARKKLGLTQAELAKKAKISRMTVSRVESGDHNLKVSALMTIAAALDKTLQIKLV